MLKKSKKLRFFFIVSYISRFLSLSPCEESVYVEAADKNHKKERHPAEINNKLYLSGKTDLEKTAPKEKICWGMKHKQYVFLFYNGRCVVPLGHDAIFS